MTDASGGLRILHLSDTHLFGDRTVHYGVVDTTAALRRVLRVAGELQAVDLVVASGDLSDDGSEASYRTLRELLEPWAAARGARVVYAMGNHDGAHGYRAVLGDPWRVLEANGTRIVVLDSSVPGHGHGELGDVQLERLRGILAQRAPRGTVVVLHHPPTPASSALLRALELQHPERLLEVCAAGDVRAILAGHYHHAFVAIEQGIPVIVAPGIANTTDPLVPAGRERAVTGSGFAVVDVPEHGMPRVAFVTAPSAGGDGAPADGAELFDLSPDEVDRIAEIAGPAR
ncbi:metallophosphoesterase [Humibacter albus]|uniref:metallophosphoesterase n=1 Tax=Humibacter albus TaxID=427754 RepID=UPI0003B6891E|nr:metallophosphoesterase [Humibacter albus]